MDFYTFIQLVVVSIAATSAMTLFSYAASTRFRELYKEPVLLAYVLIRLKFDLPIKSTIGWLLHYVIGFLFVLGYHILWHKNILPISILSALLLGVLSGIIGILSWMFIFKITDHEPTVDFKGYYLQLFVSHIIFAAVATAMYSLFLTILFLVKSSFII
jgi:hypothetical protein